jgi:hypothetical protein
VRGNYYPEVDVAKRYIGMIRLAIAEGRLFPALASRVNRIARERADEAVGRVLRELAESDELGKPQAFARGRLATTTALLPRSRRFGPADPCSDTE